MTNLLETTGLSSSVAILLSVLFILLSCGLIFLLVRGIIKDRNKFITERLQKGDLNSRSFDDMVTRRVNAAGKTSRFTLMLFEINDAKNLKDAFGEKQYNTAVSVFAERITKALPKDSKVCLYDYDTIAAFVEEDLDQKTLTDICEFCMLEGRKPINLITRVKLQLDINFGAASYDPRYSNDAELFRRDAEQALVAAKRAGFNQYVIYSPELMSGETEEYKYYQEIKQAIEDNEFTIYCQPIQDLQSNAVFGYEIFLRWNHKTMGVLSPASFLNIMEQTGDIYWVGNWAFEQTVMGLNRLIKNQPENGAIFGFNLSPKQLMNPKLCDDLMRILKKHHAPADRICMEIVEFALFEKVPQVTQNITRLGQMGFKIAIDDFGVDISSLKILENFKFDFVKLERKFIEQSQDDFLIGGVITTIVNYARQNGFKVVAEGIEDQTVLDYVVKLNVPLGQGYFFGKPLPLSEYGI